MEGKEPIKLKIASVVQFCWLRLAGYLLCSRTQKSSCINLFVYLLFWYHRFVSRYGETFTHWRYESIIQTSSDMNLTDPT